MDERRYAIFRLTISKDDLVDSLPVATAESLNEARKELARHPDGGSWQERHEHEIHLLFNGRDMGSLEMIRTLHGDPDPAGTAGSAACPLCAELRAVETASRKFGSPYPDTELPEAAGRLTVDHDFNPGGERARQLRRCPCCGTFYLYESHYESFAFGSEREERLTRLDSPEAAIYRAEARKHAARP